MVREGRAVSDGWLTLRAAPNGLAYCRLGLIVSARHGRAVVRNRIKRLLREAFRLARPELPTGMDLACAPRVGARLDLDRARRSLIELSRRLERRLQRR